MDTNLSSMRSPLVLQLSHLFLSCVWNAFGLWRVAHGEPSLGPSASWFAIGAMLCIAVALLLGVLRWPSLYWAACTIVVLAVLPSLCGAFTGEASRWPSAYWRWGGVLLNITAIAGAVWGVKCFLRSRTMW